MPGSRREEKGMRLPRREKEKGVNNYVGYNYVGLVVVLVVGVMLFQLSLLAVRLPLTFALGV